MRGRQWTVRLAAAVFALSSVTVGAASAATPASAATTTATPACTFNGSSLALVGGVTAGGKVVIACTGLPALHPYLLLQASLLIGLDPKAAALLSGGSLGVGTLEGALAALPEVDPTSLTPVFSDLSGNLNETYTVPTVQATDPNAVCPPTTEEFKSGLLGCALAMVDLTTQKPVAAGSAVLEYAGAPLFAPAPTLALSAKRASAGQIIKVSDAPGATTFWWLATLNSLEALLGGGTASPATYTVDFVGKHFVTTPATNTVTITPAAYDGTTFTPPVLSGTVTVPPGLKGKQKVLIEYQADLEGISTGIGAEKPIKITG